MPESISVLSRFGREKCGYLTDVGKARTSTRCVAPSLASSPMNCSIDRVECPIVKSLAGATLHEAATFHARRAGRRSNSGRARLVQRLPAEENPGRPHVVSHVDQEEREVAAAPQQAGENDETTHLAKQRRDGCRALG